MKKLSELEALHQVDAEAANTMQALVRMVAPCFDLGLQQELEAVEDALTALHAAATAKYNALTGKVLN